MDRQVSGLDDFVYTSTVLYANRVGTLLLGFVASLILARALRPEGLGIYSLFSAATAFLSIFVWNWFGKSQLRFGREEFVRGNSVRFAFWGGILVFTGGFSITAAVVLFAQDFVLRYLGSHQILLLMLLLLALLVGALSSMLGNVLQAANRVRQSGFIPFLRQLFFVVALLLVWTLSYSPLQAPTAIVLAIISSLFSVIQVPGSLKREWILPVSTSWSTVTRMCSWSAPFLLGAASDYVYHWMDMVFVRVFMTTADVGIYSIASRLFQQFYMLPSVLATSLFPIIMAYHVQGKQAKIQYYMSHSIAQMVLFVSLVSGAAMLFADVILPLLFGSEYKLAATPLFILLASGGFVATRVLFGVILSSFDHTWFANFTGILGSGLIVALGYVLTQRYAMNGAALSVGLAWSLEAALIAWFIARRYKTRVLKALLSGVPLTLTCLVCLAANGLLIRVISFLIITGTSLLVAKLCNLFRREDVMLIETLKMPVIVKRIAVKAIALLAS